MTFGIAIYISMLHWWPKVKIIIETVYRVKMLYIHLGTLVLEKKPKQLTYWAVVKH